MKATMIPTPYAILEYSNSSMFRCLRKFSKMFFRVRLSFFNCLSSRGLQEMLPSWLAAMTLWAMRFLIVNVLLFIGSTRGP